MNQIEIPNYCSYLFSKQPIKVLESATTLHFYFESEYGLTSCSYSKMSLIKLFYNTLSKTSI